MRRRLLFSAVAVTAALALPAQAGAAPLLADYQPVTAAEPAQYLAVTNPGAAHWAVLGVRSAPGTDHNLNVNGVPSTFYGPFADFVVADNTCGAAPKLLTARVTRVSGAGSHTIELAQGPDSLTVDPLPFPDSNPHIASIFGPGIGAPGHFIGVRNVHLVRGRPAEIYAAHVGGASGELLVMPPASLLGCGLMSRSQAVAWAAVNWGGGSATIHLNPTVTGDFALVQISYGPGTQNGYSSLRAGQ